MLPAPGIFYYCRTYAKAVSGGGEREKGGHVLRDTTSRGLYVRTSLTEVREVREQRMECWMGRGTGNVWVNRSQGEGQTEEKRGCVADDELYFP